MVKLNVHGEVADFQDADQFQPRKTQFACGFFACAMARSMAPVGKSPSLTVQQVVNDGLQWYAQYDGDPSIANRQGMDDEKEYELLHEIGLHYQKTSANIGVVKKWVGAGYPVLIAVVEASVHDLALHDTSPYYWPPVGNHIILVTGVTSDGNILVRDSANCTNLADPHSLRPGPRKYDARKLRLISATVVVPPWMSRPASDSPPITMKA